MPKMSFREYLKDSLKKGKYPDCPEEDFIEDFLLDDKTKGRRFKDPAELTGYLFTRNACAGAVQAATKLFKDWKKLK